MLRHQPKRKRATHEVIRAGLDTGRDREADLFDNAIGIGGPDEGIGFAVVLAKVAVDRRLQVDERMEDAALQAPPGQRGEKALDGIGVKWNTHLGCRASQARTLGCLWAG